MARLGFKIDTGGAYIVSVSSIPDRLSSACKSEQEVDGQIQRLKEELDSVGEGMKQAIRNRKTRLRIKER